MHSRTPENPKAWEIYVSIFAKKINCPTQSSSNWDLTFECFRLVKGLAVNPVSFLGVMVM